MIRIVYIEPVCNICNAKCVWCHLTYKCAKKMKAGMMDFNKYKKFIDMNVDFPMMIRFVLNGESILHPQFADFVNYTIDKNIELGTFTTNLGVEDLDINVLRAIARHPRVIVNFGGVRPETHFLNMGTDLDVVLDNIRRLKEIKDKINPRLRIVGKMVINKNNIYECRLLRDLLVGIADRFKFANLGFATNGDNEDRLKFARANLLDENDKKLDVPCKSIYLLQNDEMIVRPKRKTCPTGYIVVRFDGGIQCCCNVWYHDGVIGNAFETPLSDIVKTDAWEDCQDKVKRLKYVERCKYC